VGFAPVVGVVPSLSPPTCGRKDVPENGSAPPKVVPSFLFSLLGVPLRPFVAAEGRELGWVWVWCAGAAGRAGPATPPVASAAPGAARVVGCVQVGKCEKKGVNSGGFMGTSTSVSFYFLFFFS